MPSRKPIPIGQRFNRLVVIGIAPPTKKSQRGYRHNVTVQCDCGNLTSVAEYSLRNGHTQSCGCLHRENLAMGHIASTTHGLTNTREYHAWRHMRERCNNPNHHAYHHYGGRGITVCKRWNSFENFLADMGPRPPGTTLERNNNSLGYQPRNCQWTSARQQANNRRNNQKIILNGYTITAAEAIRRLNITKQTFYNWKNYHNASYQHTVNHFAALPYPTQGRIPQASKTFEPDETQLTHALLDYWISQLNHPPLIDAWHNLWRLPPA